MMSILQITSGNFLKTVDVEGQGIVDITAWQIHLQIKSKDLKMTYHTASSIGVNPEIQIVGTAPTLRFKVDIKDISSWPDKVLVSDFLFKLPDGSWWPSQRYYIDTRQGVTSRA